MRTNLCIDGESLPRGHDYPKTIEKLKERTAQMKKLARAVISLNQSGEIVGIEIHPDFVWEANYLVVVGPVTINGDKIEEAIRFEIGFKRSVPYHEFRYSNGHKKVMRRRWYIPLSDNEMVALMPTVFQIIRKIVEEELMKWNTLTYHKEIGKGTHTVFTRGIFITVPLKPSVMIYTLLIRNRHGRNNRFLNSFARQVKYEFRGLKYANYSKGELKSHPGIRAIAAKLSSAYTEEQVEWIKSRLGKSETSKNRALFEKAIEILKVKFRTKKEWYEILLEDLARMYSDRELDLLDKCRLEIATHPKLDKKRQVHATDCLRVEILPSRDFLSKHEEHSQERNRRNAIKQTSEADQDESYAIPF